MLQIIRVFIVGQKSYDVYRILPFTDDSYQNINN